MPRSEQRTLAGKVEWVRKNRVPDLPDRDNAVLIASWILIEFYSHKAAVDGLLQPHVAVTLPNAKEVQAVLRRLSKPRTPSVPAPAPIPYYNRDH